MNKLSLFSLIRIEHTDEESKKRLEKLWEKYKDGSNELPIDIAQQIKLLFDDAVNGKVMPLIKFIDSLKDGYKETIIIKAFNIQDGVSIELTHYNRLIEKLLIESKHFTGVYLGILLSILIDYKDVSDFVREILKEFLHSKYFGMYVIDVFKNDDNYPQYFHEAYYLTYGKYMNKSVSFYMDHAKEFGDSIFVKYEKYIENDVIVETHKINSSLVERIKDFNICDLIKKHSSLYSYQEVVDCINEVDNYFVNQNDIVESMDDLTNNLSLDSKLQNLLIPFLLTIFTRCKKIETFVFAILGLSYLSYSKDNNKLYKYLENLAYFPELTDYVLFTLHALPRFQNICYRIACSSKGYVQMEMIKNLNCLTEKNMRLVNKYVINNYINQSVALPVLKNMNIEKVVNKVQLNNDQIELITNLFIGAFCNTAFGELSDINNCLKILKTFYDKYLSKKEYQSHYLNTLLLTNLESNSKFDQNEAKEFHDYIMDLVVYEDVIGYIEEQLENPKMNVEEIALLIEYHNYCPLEKLQEIYKSDPNRYIRFLMTLSMYSNEEEQIDNCANLLDKIFEAKKENLVVKLEEINTEDKGKLHEYIQMMTIAGILSQIDKYYCNLYRQGISYYSPNIRKIYYKNLDKLSNVIEIEDTELFRILENNSLIEEDEEILGIINKLLGFTKINIS